MVGGGGGAALVGQWDSVGSLMGNAASRDPVQPKLRGKKKECLRGRGCGLSSTEDAKEKLRFLFCIFLVLLRYH